MIKLKGMTIKNFLSIGNITQSIKFPGNELVLVLGENLDLGGNDNRNGVGKSSIVNALSYALYGSALTFIKKNNLINKLNNRNMLVTVEFEVNGAIYRIERGRSPSIFRFIKNGVQTNKASKGDEDDDAQGENKHTQSEIDRILGMSHAMFKHIVTLNTNTEPFLSLGASAQREIIEQLLGITKLSEKASILKREIGVKKDEIKEEDFRIQGINEANKRIRKNIDDIKLRSSEWDIKKKDKIENINKTLESLVHVDIDVEIAAHKNNAEYTKYQATVKSIEKDIANLEKELASLVRQNTNISSSLTKVEESSCPACGQGIEGDTHAKLHSDFEKQLSDLNEKHTEVTEKYETKKSELLALKSGGQKREDTYYNTLDEAYTHKHKIGKTSSELERMLDEVNPYVEQIESLEKTGIQDVSFDKINELTTTLNHQEFLHKLLTNKDSFIRKKIIDQNLAYLNHKLATYLLKIGLPHLVKFKSDLDVEITLHGRDFDFDNLSRGEKTRLILSLSWAFRDIYESLNIPTNLMFIDELMDNGLDTSGVDSALAILKKMSRDSNRTIYLISHRDELESRVSSILKVVKENGFTEISAT